MLRKTRLGVLGEGQKIVLCVLFFGIPHVQMDQLWGLSWENIKWHDRLTLDETPVQVHQYLMGKV